MKNMETADQIPLPQIASVHSHDSHSAQIKAHRGKYVSKFYQKGQTSTRTPDP